MFPRFDGKVRRLCVIIVFVIVCYYFGLFTHLMERDFEKDFDYPLEGEVYEYAKTLKVGDKPAVPPINWYNFTFLTKAEHKCHDEEGNLIKPRLVIIVKSALNHFEQRNAIRNTWGFEKRFSDVVIRTIFSLGVLQIPDIELQIKIDAENAKFNDIVQSRFVDSYFNNTIKTMMGFKWAMKFCPRSKFYFFVDDDYYVSVKNILKFVRNPSNYPEFIEEAEELVRQVARRLTSSTQKISTQFLNQLDSKGNIMVNNTFIRHKRQLFDLELSDDTKLFAGFVFKSAPHRHQTSKWYISLKEYPWNIWPTYVTAGAFLLSREALHDMYYTSFYTKHFRFDDIYLALVAMKAHIEPLHSEEFYFQKANVPEHKYLIASHGFSNPRELTNTWIKMRSSGFA